MDSAIPGAQNATPVVGGTSSEFGANTTAYPRWYDTGLDWPAATVSISLWINQELETPNREQIPVNNPPAGADKTITIRMNATHAFVASDFRFGYVPRVNTLIYS